jgi:hypothetical protein
MMGLMLEVLAVLLRETSLTVVDGGPSREAAVCRMERFEAVEVSKAW